MNATSPLYNLRWTGVGRLILIGRFALGARKIDSTSASVSRSPPRRDERCKTRSEKAWAGPGSEMESSLV